MSQDHYIARTYLKHFGDPSANGMLRGYKKWDVAEFPCWPKDVCSEWDGDKNPAWLSDENLLGDFRRLYEPWWNSAIAEIEAGRFGVQEKFVIAGLMANFMVCTPAWRRVGVEIHNAHLTGFAKFSAAMGRKHGASPDLPLGTLEAVESGEIVLDTEPDFIQAMNARNLMKTAWLLHNQDWIFIKNQSDLPFITSDNPVAIFPNPDAQAPLIRLLPLTPKYCVYVQSFRQEVPPFDPSQPPLGQIRPATADAIAAERINRAQAQCAEKLVFSAVRSDAVKGLVRESARYGMEAEYVEFPAAEPDAMYQGTIIRVRERAPGK